MTLQAPYYADGSVVIHHGDALDVMAEMDPENVQCCVTSPPYWGLRRYADEQERAWADGVTCAYGQEPTVALYVAHTVEVLRAIRRVLRNDGLTWWVVGDAYSNTGHHGEHSGGKSSACAAGAYPRERKAGGIAHKNLCLIPQRVAIAAQDDGWWVRSIIIWAKTNPMPESVRDRCTTAHEYILMLAQSERYYYDAEAVREPNHPDGRHITKVVAKQFSIQHRNGERWPNPAGRNLRSVWNIATKPYSGAHFATFPPELPRRCIMAATSEAGNCEKCGEPWSRVLEPYQTAHDGRTTAKGDDQSNYKRLALVRQHLREHGMENAPGAITLGWKPSCQCGAPALPALVLDPFAGSGTTGAVAKSLGRRAILIDRSEEYCGMAARRVQAVSMPMRMEAVS